MIDHPYFDLFEKSGVNKQLRIEFDGGVITNKDLYFEQFSLTESLFSGNVLSFGKCESSTVKFRIANIFEPLVGKNIVGALMLNKGADDPLPLGRYKVFSDTPTADKKYRDIVAYDQMYDIINADVAEWYNGLTFPMTLKNFRKSFAEHFGISEVPVTLVNDDLVVERTILAAEISGKAILTAICEINGCFGHINRYGNLEYVRIGKKGAYEISKYKAPLKYENYVVQPITKVQIRQEEGDHGGTYGEGDNSYVVQGNFLTFGKEESDLIAYAQNLLGEIGNVVYRPYSVSTYGNPCVEVGDAITIHSKEIDIVSVVLSRTVKCIQGMQDSYSASGEEKVSKQLNTAKNELQQLREKTNILTRTLDETKSAITEVNGKIDEVDGDLRTEISTQKTTILQDAQGIVSNALSSYVLQTDFNTFSESTESKIKQTDSDWRASFETTTETITSIDGKLNSEVKKREQWFQMDEDGLEIGQSDSPFKVVIDNDRFSMYSNNVEFLWLKPSESDGSNIPILNVKDKFTMLGYQFVEDEDGRVNEVYVGV